MCLKSTCPPRNRRACFNHLGPKEGAEKTDFLVEIKCMPVKHWHFHSLCPKKQVFQKDMERRNSSAGGASLLRFPHPLWQIIICHISHPLWLYDISFSEETIRAENGWKWSNGVAKSEMDIFGQFGRPDDDDDDDDDHHHHHHHDRHHQEARQYPWPTVILFTQLSRCTPRRTKW